MKRGRFVKVCALALAVSTYLAYLIETRLFLAQVLGGVGLQPTRHLPSLVGGTAILVACCSTAGLLWATAGWFRERGATDDRADLAEPLNEPADEDSERPTLTFVDVVLLQAGVLLLGAVAVVWVAPTAVPSGVLVAATVPTDALTDLLLRVGGAIGLAVLVATTFGGQPEVQRRLGAIEPPEEPRRERTPLVGEEFDWLLSKIDERDVGRNDPVRLKAEARDVLEDVAIETVARAEGLSRAEAAELFATGDWTESRAVAAFTATENSPPAPLLVRFFDWISAESAFVRQVERTIAELDRIADERGEGPA